MNRLEACSRITRERIGHMLYDMEQERLRAFNNRESHPNFGEDFEASLLDLSEARDDYQELMGLAYDLADKLTSFVTDGSCILDDAGNGREPCGDCEHCRAVGALEEYRAFVEGNPSPRPFTIGDEMEAPE